MIAFTSRCGVGEPFSPYPQPSMIKEWRCFLTGLCPAGGFFFTGNTASNSTSGYQSSVNGQLTLLGSTPTDPGTVDSSATADGHFLYVQTGGNGIVDEFQVGASGSQTEIGSVTVPGAVGGEGIVAF